MTKVLSSFKLLKVYRVITFVNQIYTITIFYPGYTKVIPGYTRLYQVIPGYNYGLERLNQVLTQLDFSIIPR